MVGEVHQPQQGLDIDPNLKADFEHIINFLEQNPEVAEFFTSIIHVMENSQGVPTSSQPPLPESRVAPFVGTKKPIK